LTRYERSLFENIGVDISLYTSLYVLDAFTYTMLTISFSEAEEEMVSMIWKITKKRTILVYIFLFAALSTLPK